MIDYGPTSGITIIRASNSAIITLSDGRRIGQVLPSPVFEKSSRLVCVHVALSDGLLVAITNNDDHVTIELPLDGGGGEGHLGNRLVVYLDQNHASAVSKARSAPSDLKEPDRSAAHQLMDWSKRGLVVVPMSAGHLYETGKWASKNRYALGLTLLDLSKGWQVQDPLQVRRHELRSLLAKISDGEHFVTPSVITLMPEALFASRGVDYSPSPDIVSSPLGPLFSAILSATVTIDTLLDTECLEPGASGGWTPGVQKFHDYVGSQNGTSAERRRAIDAYILNDLQQELAEIAAVLKFPPSVLGEWLAKRGLRDFRELPALGLWREMLHDRLGNTRGRVWDDNDLHDMVYLTCAAGYSDFVICEKSSAAHLRQGLKRLGRDCQVFHRLIDAVDAIDLVLEARGLANTQPAS